MKCLPNIILITVHDLGRHLQCYDSDLPSTPAICGIAEKGALFKNHYSTSPLCSPARASIQSGRYPHSNGMNGLTHRGFSLNKEEKCISHYLNDIGYHTAIYGHQHETEDDLGNLGYREICTKPQYPQTCLEIMPHVDDLLKKERKKPLFLSLGFWEVHRSFKQQEHLPIDLSEVKVPSYLPDCPEVREDLADFYGLIKKVDKA